MMFITTSSTTRNRSKSRINSCVTNIRYAYDYALVMIIYAFALLLLCRCLETTYQVSAWVSLPLTSPVRSNYRNRNGNNGNGIVIIYSTTEDTTTSTTDESQQLKSPAVSMPLSLTLPSIKYTVAGMKRGWKDSETGVWMDEDGPRNGPPLNYWRQQSDEKQYNESMQLVKNVLLLLSSSSSSSENKKKLNELVRPIEKTNSVRRPFLNRLILNDWAPIVRGGKIVATTDTDITATATATATAKEGNNNDNRNKIDVPCFFHIQRTAGQKLAPKTHYGTFDEHLEPEEEITIMQQQQLVDDDTTITKSDDDDDVDNDNVVVSSSEGVVKVSSDKNEIRLVKNDNNSDDDDDDDDSLYMGGITYISKYLMIMRQQQESQEQQEDDTTSSTDSDSHSDSKVPAAVTEIWMRVDP